MAPLFVSLSHSVLTLSGIKYLVKVSFDSFTEELNLFSDEGKYVGAPSDYRLVVAVVKDAPFGWTEMATAINKKTKIT